VVRGRKGEYYQMLYDFYNSGFAEVRLDGKFKSLRNKIELKKIDEFKFGGGWINLLSTKLLKLTDIPDSFGPYGIDDLYVMICCNIMKQKGKEVNQYVIDGLVVIENFKYRNNYQTDFLYLVDNQKEYRARAEANLNIELDNFNRLI
jgi:hypothetical protein